MSKETPVTGGNDSYVDLDRQVWRLSRPSVLCLLIFLFCLTFKLLPFGHKMSMSDVNDCFSCLIHIDTKFLIIFFPICSQLKKTVEDLNDALATKEEISQRCRELDMQVGLMHLLCPII